jgi:hypothetical protein
MELNLGRKLLKGEQVDHKNHDTLDNTDENLRVVSCQGNLRNQRVQRKTKSSKYKGVSWHDQNSKWQAYIRINRKYKYLGYFTDEVDAAIAYNEAAIMNFGEHASLNVVEMIK